MVDVPPSTTAGYDDPISDEAADLLGRAGFARELATLAVASPYGWSTRIGVYGEWGEGKTSVVRLAQRYLEGEGHLTIEYNPWGCRNTDEMISILADQILAVAKKARLEVPGRAKRLAKKVGGFFGGAAKKADQLALPGPAAAAAPVISAAARFSPWLERWAKDRKEDIEKTLRVIDLDRRLVVFVDDVDRLDPKLLPSLLFALHEVFAIPGVTFVVALDPAVVGNALHEYHRGFGDGLAFLEKIVQFPRWLPPVAREDLLKVAEADRRLFTPFLSAGVLTDNRDLLPTNPRELRMLIRGLMPLQRAVSRHDSDELDQNLLLLLACFRQRFPLTLARLLDDETLLDRCSASFVASKAAPKFISSVVSLAVQTKELASEEMGDRADRFQRLVAAFCGRSIFWDAQRIRYHAFLTDRPHAVTWREFRTVIAAPPNSGANLDEWITRHSLQVKAPASSVAAELFECCVRTHQNTMDESASVPTVEAQADQVRHAGKATALLRLLWFSSTFSAGIRTPQRFRQVVGTFRHWAHFDLNANDRAQREAERALLDEMIATIDDPTECLALMKPWRHDDLQDNAATLTERVTNALIARASNGALRRFGVPSGIATMFHSKMYAAEYVLTRTSPTWAEAKRSELIELAAAHPQVAAENLRLFVENLVEPNSFSGDTRTLLADRRLVELWWRLITAVRWQARFFRGLEKLKSSIEGSTPLPVPPWWEGERRTAYRTADPPASPEHATPGGADVDDDSQEPAI